MLLRDQYEDDDLEFRFGMIVDRDDKQIRIECQVVDIEDGVVIAIGWGRHQVEAMDDAVDSWCLLAESGGLVQA